MATIKDFVVKQGISAQTTIVVNGVNVLANDYATHLSASANDYNTYTTLVGFINTVQGNVGAGASGYEANDYATLLAAYSNDGATLASARSNDYATFLAASANDYNSYTTLQGEYRSNDYATYLNAQSNDGATLASARANDYSTYTTLQGEFAANDYATYLNAQSNDGVTLGSARANDYNTYTTLQGEYRANDYATYLAALSNDGATLASASANDYNTYTTLQGEYRANDYATYLAALSNDGATLGTARANDYATYTAALANDFNSYTTIVGLINTVQDNVTSGGDASNTFVNANDWTTYSTLVNEYQANDYATYTALVSEYKANDYATWNGLNGAINIKANSSVNIIAGDGLNGGGALTGNVTLDVDSTVVRTSGDQTINGVKTFGDSIVVQGNLTVNGNVTTVASTNLVVDDRFIELGANTTGLPSADTGIYFNRGASGNSAFYYDQSEGWFALVNSNDPTTNVTVSPTSYSWLKLDTLLVSNTSVVTNLNADRLDSQEGSYYLNFGNATNTNLITLASVTANGATTSSAISVGGLNVDSGTLYVDSTNNYVGVGTVEPRAKLQVSDVGIHTATLTTTATTANQVVDSWSATVFRTAKYTVQVHDTVNNYYHASEILIIHNGTTPHLTEYAIVFTDSSLATFDADISGGNVRLLITPTNTNNDITVVRHTLTV
jgi:hypothetical protein